jgi:L-alanine-DL-glutamate epimerase-like enolase superfamily enzyme
MNRLSLAINRIDLPVKEPLVLGPGLVIHTIPYYYAEISDGKTTGVGWSVSSPLWGGLAHIPLEEGIRQVETWLMELAAKLLENYRNCADLAGNLNTLHDEGMKAGIIPPLIKGMILSPIEGALCDMLAKQERRTMVEFLKTRIATDQDIFTERPLEYLVPFLTIGGSATSETVSKQIETYGKRKAVKFKIGSKKDPLKEIAAISDIMLHVLPADTLMVIDNNQAYAPEQCREIVSGLGESGVLGKLMFFEQPCRRGEEPDGIDALFSDIAPSLPIALDESVGNADDIARVTAKFAVKRPENIIVIPKFEKGGLIETVRVMEAARKHNLKISPSTLTGPPPQVPQYWELFRHAADVVTMPGESNSFPAEANGYEILDWPEAVKTLMSKSESGQTIFSVTENRLSASPPLADPWPPECAIKSHDEIPWKSIYKKVALEAGRE